MDPTKYLPSDNLPDKTPAIDLAMIHLGKHADDSKVRRIASMGPEESINQVMRRSKLDLGGDCSLVNCHCASKPSACILYPLKDPETGRKRITCSGPVGVQKEKRKLLGGKKTVYDYRQPFSDCVYQPDPKSKIGEKGTLLVSELDKYPDSWKDKLTTDLTIEDIEF